LYRVDTLKQYKSCDEIDGFKKRARSLIVIVSTPPTNNYKDFTERVRKYNVKPPFNITVPSILVKFETFVSIYAAYLYDAVKLYAKALDTLIRAKQDEIAKNTLHSGKTILSDEMIQEIASNGTAIIAAIINNKKYDSVAGAEIFIDKNGDSEGNFSVLVLKEANFSIKEGLKCGFHMVPIATFQGKNSDDTLPVNFFLKAS
jgi:guanylate cyclase